MKIAVMGAGGIGGYVGGRLAEAGEDVHFIARGAHLEALRHTGLQIKSPHGDAHIDDVHATDNPSDIGIADLVLFTVKLGDTDAAARSLKPMIGEQTKIVSLQNGIDAKSLIGKYVDPSRIAAGIIYIAAYITEPGVITNPGGVHKLVVDGLDGGSVMADFFETCGRAVAIDASPTDQPEHTIWGKFISVVALAGVTSLSRLPIGAVYEHPETLVFMRQLVDENIAVARASGLDFDASHAEMTMDLFGNQPFEQKSSMQVDLEAGKPLELEWLSGRVHQLGKELSVATPANSAVWAALAPYRNGPPKLTGG